MLPLLVSKIPRFILYEVELGICIFKKIKRLVCICTWELMMNSKEVVYYVIWDFDEHFVFLSIGS